MASGVPSTSLDASILTMQLEKANAEKAVQQVMNTRRYVCFVRKLRLIVVVSVDQVGILLSCLHSLVFQLAIFVSFAGRV